MKQNSIVKTFENGGGITFAGFKSCLTNNIFLERRMKYHGD